MKIATLKDVVHVGETMWTRGKEELHHLGILYPDQWFAGWYTRVLQDRAVSFGPHAILGWDPEGQDVCSAFQASTSFEEPGIGFQVTKEMRRAIPELMRGRNVKRYNTYSLCIDPEAPKWFRLLGMEEDLTYQGTNHGPYRLRKFWRNA